MTAGASAMDSAWASTTATSRSRSEPSTGGIGEAGMRLLKAAASKSFPLGSGDTAWLGPRSRHG